MHCAAPVWSPYSKNFRLIRLRKFRGQWPTGPAGDDETRVVSAKCLMSLNGHLLRPMGISPPTFSFTRFIVEQCLLKKTSTSSHDACSQFKNYQVFLSIFAGSLNYEYYARECEFGDFEWKKNKHLFSCVFD